MPNVGRSETAARFAPQAAQGREEREADRRAGRNGRTRHGARAAAIRRRQRAARFARSGTGGGCRRLIRLRQTVPDGAAHAPRARKRAKQDKGRGGRKLYNHYESPDREGIIIYPHSTDGNRETLRLYNPNKQLSLTPLRG